MKGKAIVALVSMSLALSMLIGRGASVPYGTWISGKTIPSVYDIWTLTSSPDRRIWGGTSGSGGLGWSTSQLFYYLPKVCNSTDKMDVIGNLHLEVYALTTSVCGINITTTTSYPYFVYGGSFTADPTWDSPAHGAHLFKYVPSATSLGPDPWTPGYGNPLVDNPYDYGPWHRITGGPGLAHDSVFPTNTLIYKLSAGPCGKIYGGSGWDAPHSSGSIYGDYAYFFVFDPIAQNIVFYKLYPNATSVSEVLAGRDGNVYFLTQYDTHPGQTQHTVLYMYNPVMRTVTPILDSSTITSGSYVFTCMTWSVDHNGNPRIYIGATETLTGLAWLIQLDPTTYAYYFPPTALWDTTNNVKIGTIRDLTTGITSEEVYGVGYGQDSQGNAHGYFFMFCQCKTQNDVHWGYWKVSTDPKVGDPWIAGSPAPKLGPVDRLRTIVTGQEAQNGYCVSNPDPHVYMGAGSVLVPSATLFSYLPLTPDLDLDQNVGLSDLVQLALEYGIDPPIDQAATASPAPINPLILALSATAAIALVATVYKLERRKISKL